MNPAELHVSLHTIPGQLPPDVPALYASCHVVFRRQTSDKAIKKAEIQSPLQLQPLPIDRLAQLAASGETYRYTSIAKRELPKTVYGSVDVNDFRHADSM